MANWRDSVFLAYPAAKRAAVRGGIAICAVLFASGAFAQPVTLERDAPLYSEARFESRVVATLKQGSAAEVVAKSGAWLHLKSADATGWLLSFNVRFASGKPEAAPASGGSALGRVFGPRQSVSVTSTIGIRGLDEEDLKQARFDGGQMKLLDQSAASRPDAEAAANATGLTPARIDYFDARTP